MRKTLRFEGVADSAIQLLREGIAERTQARLSVCKIASTNSGEIHVDADDQVKLNQAILYIKLDFIYGKCFFEKTATTPT